MADDYCFYTSQAAHSLTIVEPMGWRLLCASAYGKTRMGGKSIVNDEVGLLPGYLPHKNVRSGGCGI
jgi:hypothetical protein